MNVPLIRLNEGDAVVIDDVWYKEDSRTTGALTLSAIGSGIQRTFTGDELRDLYFDPAGRMKIVRKHMAALKEELREVVSRPFESFSVEQQAEMIKRLDYVNACDRFFARKLYSKRPDEGYASIAKIVARHRRFVRARLENCATSGVPLEAVSGSTLRDWYGRWCKSGRMLGALAPRWHRRGNTKTVRMDPAIRMIIADAVREKWLTLEAPPLTVVYDYICQKVVKRNENVGDGDLSAPSEMAVRRWIKKNVDPYTQTFFRLGKKEANQQFRLTRKAPVAVRPLEIVEYDDTPLDIILVDANGRVRGRAYLTAGICLATGMIVGWHISKDRPSWSTVMQALRMTVLKKDLADSGAESPYPVFGVPEMVKVDNGAAYRSTSLVAAAGQLQFELRLVPVGKPNLKGKVERFFREVARDFLSVFPGRTFSNVQERLDYDSEGNARMTLQDAQRLFTRWVVDIYHNRPNSRSFGQTPLQRWEALSGCGVRMPPEAADLTPLIGLIVNRTIQGDGITFMGLTYRDEALRAMRRSGHMGKEWMVKVDPLDLSVMLVLDEAKKGWVPIRCQQPELVEGLTLKMWMDVVAAAKAATKRGQRVSHGRLLRAREALILEAQAMGNRPRGKITVAEYSWIESELKNPKYEVDADLSDPDAQAKAATTPAAQRKKEQSARAKSATLDAEAPADDPTMVEPASKAEGYSIVDVDLPGRELKERELEVSRDIEDLEEEERLAEFRAASGGKPTEATDDVSVAQTPALDSAESPSLAPDETEVGAADAIETPWDRDVAPPLAPGDEPRVASGTAKGPRRLVDEDDDKHFGG